MKAIVIGSGIGGLATAIRLRAQGLDVEVFEANNYPGGKLHSFELGDFRFDGGPSLFTMPHYVVGLIQSAGLDPKDYFEFHQCDHACHYFWEDGHELHAKSNVNSFAREAASEFGVEESTILSYFNHVKNIYDHSGKIFLEQSLHKMSTWMSTDTMQSLLRIGQFDLFKSMNKANEHRIREPHLVQLFNRFATYNGSNPYKAPGILNVIPWLEHGFGTFFPKGGMQSIPQALYKAGADLGVIYHFNTSVTSIETEGSTARGITTASGFHGADIVISNMDVYFTYSKLLTQVPAPKRVMEQERSSSALVFYWGIDREFEKLGLHNILFSEDYPSEFRGLFDQGEISSDPTVYINISSKEEESDAPHGCENWFVMINVPNNDGQDWEALSQVIRDRTVSKINSVLKTDIEKHIVEERVWNPVGIESDTSSYKGALYGSSSNDMFAAFVRHPNFSRQVKGLYFCGGTVHPGGGIPLALLSAKITSELIADDLIT